MKIQNLPQKSKVNPDNEILIVCPECSFSKNFSAKQFRNRQNLLKIKCRCGHSFRVQLEFRLHIRKETDLKGVCKFGNIGGLRVSLINLSLGGVCLEIRGKHRPTVGARGELLFTLDDRKATVIEKKIVVRSISTYPFRCEFIQDRAYQKELGFYLMP